MKILHLLFLGIFSLTSCTAGDWYTSKVQSQSVQITVDGQTRTVGLGTTLVFRDKDGSKPTTVTVAAPTPTPAATPAATPIEDDDSKGK